MDRSFIIRLLSLYLPLVGCGLIWLWRKPARLEATGALLASAWNVPALLIVNLLAHEIGWWQFNAHGGVFLTVPVDLWLGWAASWGTFTVLLFRRTQLWVVAIILVLADLFLMPLGFPVVVLGRNWLLGEACAVLGCLIPGLLLAKWTRDQLRLADRAVLQMLCFSGFLAVLISALFWRTDGTGAVALLTARPMYAWAPLLFLINLPGLSAVQEFVIRGGGTPLPFDPPRRLVVSGPYAYVANPMQISTTMLLFSLAAILHSVWLAMAAASTVFYAAGIAAWDEGQDLQRAYGGPFVEYRQHVRNWFPSWRPYMRTPAILYLAQGCGMCSELERFLVKLRPRALQIVPAEDHPLCDLERMTYDSRDGAPDENGVKALGRAFEHINLGWALLGMVLRLPGICQLLQAIADASGAGPRRIQRRISQ